MRVVIGLFVLVAACGRIGFDNVDDLDVGDIGDEIGDDIFDSETFPVTPYSVDASNPALEWNGHEVGLVFEQDKVIGGVRLSALGDPGDAMTEMVVSGSASRPRLCATNGDFVVVFDDGSGSQRTIFVGDFGGSVTPMTAGRALAPSVASANGAVGIVWRRDSSAGSLDFGLMTSAGPMTKKFAELGDNYDPKIASSSDGFGVVWQQITEGKRRLLYTTIERGGTPVVPFDMGDKHVLAEDDAKNQTIAWDGSSYVVVWTDSRDSNLMMARFAPNGELELEPTPITTTEQGGGAPALAVRGDEIAIAFRSEGSISHLRVDRDGVEVAAPFEISHQDRVNIPSIIATDLGYIVAWQADVDGNGSTEIYARAFAH